MDSTRISDAFLTLAELAVAIAGFSGIILVFVERPERMRAEDRIRIFQLLSVSITSVPLALIPYALALMGLRDALVWRISSGIAALNHLVLTAVYLRLLSGLTAAERANLIGTTFGRRAIALAIAAFTATALVLLVLNGSGLLLHGEQWPYFVVLLGAVTMSAAYLLLIVLIRPSASD